MAAEPLDLLRQNLDAVRDELVQAMDAAQPVELDQTVQGRLSRMDAMQQQAMAANRIERLKLQTRRIEAAIDRCRAGSYGICCRCEAEIEAERLRADPATPFCTACTRET